jgi:PilZ domain
VSTPGGKRNDDKRHFPRIAVNLSVRMRRADGPVVSTTAHDITPAGLQIRCDRATALAIQPSGRYVAGEPGQRVLVRFALPLRAGSTVVDVESRLAHLSILPDAPAERGIALGLEFERFVGEGRKVLQRFIEEVMQPLEM